jgi:hypothetical protein
MSPLVTAQLTTFSIFVFYLKVQKELQKNSASCRNTACESFFAGRILLLQFLSAKYFLENV